MILLQHIQTEWTKLSRGHPQSQERNNTPEVIEISIPTIDFDVCLHRVLFREGKSFTPESTVIINPQKDERSNLAVLYRRFEKKLVFNFCWSWNYVGAPERRSSEVFSLQEGQYGRIRFNGRFGAQSSIGQEWIYRKNIIHAFYGSPSNNRIFLDTAPDKTFDSIEDLK